MLKISQIQTLTQKSDFFQTTFDLKVWIQTFFCFTPNDLILFANEKKKTIIEGGGQLIFIYGEGG